MRPIKQNNSMKELLKKLRRHDTLLVTAAVVVATVLCGAFVYVTTPTISADAAKEENKKDSLGVQIKAGTQLKEIENYLEKLDKVVTESNNLVNEIRTVQTKQRELVEKSIETDKNITTETEKTTETENESNSNSTKVVEKINGLDKELQSIHSEISSTNEFVKKLKDSIDKGGAGNAEKDKEQFTQITNALYEIQRSCDKSGSDVSGIIDELRNANDKSNESDKDIIKSLENIMKSFEKIDTKDTLTKMESELRDTQSTYITLLGDLEKNINRTSENVKKVKESVSKVGENVGNVESGVKDVYAAQNGISSKIDDVRNGQNGTDRMIEGVRNSQEGTNSKIDAVRSAQNDTDSKVDELRSTQDQVNSKIESVRSAQDGVSSTLNELKETQNGTNTKIDDVRETQNGTNAKIDEVSETQKGTNLMIGDIQTIQRGTGEKLELLGAGLGNFKNDFANMNNNVGDVRSDIEDVRSDMNDVRDDVSKVSASVEELQRYLELLEESIGSNNQKINSIDRNIEKVFQCSDSYRNKLASVLFEVNGNNAEGATFNNLIEAVKNVPTSGIRNGRVTNEYHTHTDGNTEIDSNKCDHEGGCFTKPVYHVHKNECYTTKNIYVYAPKYIETDDGKGNKISVCEKCKRRYEDGNSHTHHTDSYEEASSGEIVKITAINPLICNKDDSSIDYYVAGCGYAKGDITKTIITYPGRYNDSDYIMLMNKTAKSTDKISDKLLDFDIESYAAEGEPVENTAKKQDSVDKPTYSDNATADNATTDNATADKGTTDNATTDKAATDNATADNATTGNATTDNAVTESAAAEKLQPGQGIVETDEHHPDLGIAENEEIWSDSGNAEIKRDSSESDNAKTEEKTVNSGNIESEGKMSDNGNIKTEENQSDNSNC
ncbi:hypothetical protein [Butyrivibrio sp. AE3004]|uniref:hypothetical protein n=1 Tax=Butyrivibrio sp. AE3004 TaxID=1506994 RepID=UPI0004946A7C|nr:hypothetical protein [Butyrivibrio sp. AE3004]